MEDAGLLPAGVPLGSMMISGSQSRQAMVRRRRDLLMIDGTEYDTWMRARVSASILQLQEWASSQSIGEIEFDGITSRLIAKGLLVVLPVELRQRAELVCNFRLVPLCLTLGNTPNSPDLFAIGTQELHVLAVLDAELFDVWARCDGTQSIAAACRRASIENGTEPGILIVKMTQALPALLSSGAAVVD